MRAVAGGVDDNFELEEGLRGPLEAGAAANASDAKASVDSITEGWAALIVANGSVAKRGDAVLQ